MQLLFIFLDGIGLGPDKPDTNPLARAEMPTLQSLLNGQKLLASSAPFHGEHASLLALDASLGVDGLPQSATGQAVLMTGVNVPAALGYHYGPKPNPEVAHYLNGSTIFSWARTQGKSAALLNAYPQGYFDGIESGKRLYSAIPLAVTNAGISLFTQKELFEGEALSADFTGQGWREMLKVPDAPLLNPREAGEKLVELALCYDFSLFEYWASDYAGHKQKMDWAVRQMEVFDEVLEGIVDRRQPGVGSEDELLVLVTSDHGNMEDLTTRRHTLAQVPCLLIGSQGARNHIVENLETLTDIAPTIIRALTSKYN